jgi:riboflavin synthase alpha subunit
MSISAGHLVDGHVYGAEGVLDFARSVNSQRVEAVLPL